jgi:hypothetical protein
MPPRYASSDDTQAMVARIAPVILELLRACVGSRVDALIG